MYNKCLIVFTGFNQRAVIAFIRTIEKHHIKYGLIARSDDDPIFLTIYSDKVVKIRRSLELNIDDIIDSITSVQKRIEADEYIIAPSTEALNRFLIENRLIIEQYNAVIPLVEKSLYEKISDKLSFSEVCKKNGIKVPKEFFEFSKAPLPFVAKPKKYISCGNKIYSPCLIFNEKEKKEFLNKFPLSDFYFQEYLQGASYYLLYYFHRNGQILKYSQQNIIQQPDGKSILAAISSDFHNSIESEKYETLFKSLGYHGLVMVEIKQVRDESIMIEANPRFWGPSQLFVDANMNFFEGFLNDYSIIDFYPKFNKQTKKYKYFWFGGIIDSWRTQTLLTFHHGNLTTLLHDLPDWIKIDIYRRPDTENIFMA